MFPEQNLLEMSFTSAILLKFVPLVLIRLTTVMESIRGSSSVTIRPVGITNASAVFMPDTFNIL